MSSRRLPQASPRAAHAHGSAPRRAAIVIGTAAAVTMTISAPLPASSYVSEAEARLLATIGVGPSFDGFGLSIPLFFYGTVVPQGDSFHTVPYPAQINFDYPVISALPALSDLPYWPQSLKRSEAVGVGYLEQDIAQQPTGDKTTIIGMSQGSQVAEIARADMAKNAAYVAAARNYEFILLGDPYQPNGGILSRFTAWSDYPLLGDLFPFGPPGPSDSPFKTTIYQNQYDGVADFPAYFNILAIANAVAGILFEHAFPGYVLESKEEPGTISTTVGNTTYVTIPQRLPLLTPLRVAASLIGAQRLVDALDPIVRVLVERGYDRTADPSQVKEFSWTTPAAKTREAFEALPGAVAESLAILSGATYTPTLPEPTVDTTGPPAPVTERPARPVDTTAAGMAWHTEAVDVAAALTTVTQTLAALLRDINNHAPAQTTNTTINRNAQTRADEPAGSSTTAGEDLSSSVARVVRSPMDPQTGLRAQVEAAGTVPTTQTRDRSAPADSDSPLGSVDAARRANRSSLHGPSETTYDDELERAQPDRGWPRNGGAPTTTDKPLGSVRRAQTMNRSTVDMSSETAHSDRLEQGRTDRARPHHGGARGGFAQRLRKATTPSGPAA